MRKNRIVRSEIFIKGDGQVTCLVNMTECAIDELGRVKAATCLEDNFFTCDVWYINPNDKETIRCVFYCQHRYLTCYITLGHIYKPTRLSEWFEDIFQ